MNKYWKKVLEDLLPELAKEEELELKHLEDVWFSVRKGVKWAITRGNMDEIRVPYLLHFVPVPQIGVRKIMKMTKTHDYYKEEVLERRLDVIEKLINKNGNDVQKRILEYALSLIEELEDAGSKNHSGSEGETLSNKK